MVFSRFQRDKSSHKVGQEAFWAQQGSYIFPEEQSVTKGMVLFGKTVMALCSIDS